MKINKLVFVPLLVTFFALTSCGQKDRGASHNVTFSSMHGTWSGDNLAYESEDYKATFTPEEGYMLDEATITVTVNKQRIVGCYTFYDNVLTVSKDYLLGDIEIKAYPYLISYNAVVRVGYTIPSYESPRYHKQFDVTFRANPGYRLPDAMDVYVDGNKLIPNTGYEYVLEENRLSIFPEYVDGDILITSEGVKLSELTFDGVQGKWDEGPVKTILVDAGVQFSVAKDSAGTPKVSDNSERFDHWAFDDGKDTPVPDTYVTKDGDHFKAVYVVSEFQVRVHDTYFPTDLYKGPLIKWHESLTLPLVIAEEDRDPDPETSSRSPRRLPDTVEVTCQTTHGQVPIDASYIRYNEFEGEINIASGKIEGDVQIKMSTPIVANITFCSGEGAWNVEKSRKDDVKIALVTDKTYTILEAWRYAQIELGLTNDPVADNNDNVFIGWENSDGELVNVNSEITTSVKLTAHYEGRTFENDTWDNVILAANAGLDFLYETYDTNEQYILASTRNLIVGNSTVGYSQQKVRLIGVGQDVVANSQGSKAALTFEFTNTFYELEFGVDRVYRDSSIRAALNNTLVNSIPTFLNLKDKMTTIREVEKVTNIPGQGLVTTTDKCFLLSANEMALTSNDMPSHAEVIGGEGPVYTYYANGGDRTKGESPFVDTANYWLRSEDHTVSTGTQNVYAINEEAKVYTLSTRDSIGVAPAFAIGLAEHDHHTGKIVTTNCTSISHGSEFTVVDNERGFVSDIVFEANDGYLFNDTNDATLTVSPGGDGSEVNKQVTISDDHKTLKVTISYNDIAADPDNTITLTVGPSIPGYPGTINLNCCTSISGATGFVINTGTAKSITDTYTTKHGYIFTGNIEKDITYTKKAPTGNITVTDYSYSPDHTILTATINIDEAAALGAVTLNIGTTTEGYLGKITFEDCTTESGGELTFPIARGEEASNVITVEAHASYGYYFNVSNPISALTYTSDAGGQVTFGNVAVSGEDNDTLTFTVSYDRVASYGAIEIKAKAILPYHINFVGVGIKETPNPITIIPGCGATTESITVNARDPGKTDDGYEFIEPWSNNFLISQSISSGNVSINISSADTKTISFTITFDEVAAGGNITVQITAQPV